MRITYLALAGLLVVAALPAHAGTFTTVDISSVVNGHVDRNPQTFPLGTTTGNKGTNIPFQIAPYNGVAGTFIANGGTGDTFTLHVSIPGQASFYALLNNYYGTPGADEYDVTVGTLSGGSILINRSEASIRETTTATYLPTLSRIRPSHGSIMASVNDSIFASSICPLHSRPT